MNQKRVKKLHKIFTWFTVFSLVFQMGSGALLYRPVFAEEETHPETVVEETVTPEEEPAPAEEETPAEPVDEAPAEEPIEEPLEEVVEEPIEEPLGEPTEEPVLTVEQEVVVAEETPEEAIVEEEPIEEPAPELEQPEVAEESAELNPSVFTDKEDYAPGETVKITGENFPANTVLVIRVTRPDSSVVKGDGSFEEGSDEVTSDKEGRFEYHYQLNGIEGEYLVEVLLGETVLATATFTDNAGYDVQLTSPTPPTSSTSFTWTVSGSKPEGGQEISHVDIYGCWGANDVVEATASAGSIDYNGIGHASHVSKTDGLVTVDGIQDSNLPLSVTITFNQSYPSDGSATAFVKTGGGPDVGFEFLIGGPNCETPELYCGDGILDPGEQCDDGNDNDDDYCSNSCQFNRVCLPEVNMVVNGDFESPVVGTSQKWDIYPSGTAYLGWNVEWYGGSTSYGSATRPDPANLELHRGVVNSWNPQEGSQYAELDTDWDGPGNPLNNEPASVSIYQDLPTIPGYQYQVKFYFSPRPNTNAANNQLQFSWGGEVKDTISRDGSGNSNTDWSEHEYTFTATSPITQIRFTDLGNTDSLGTFLDDVSVVCLEPVCQDVTGRKINADTEEGVEGWPIYLLEKIDTVSVLPDGNSYPSSVSLNNGEDYYIEALGTYIYITPGSGGSSGLADAEYSDRPSWSYGPGWKKGEDVFPPAWTNALDVLINGSNIDWGEYHPFHRYSTIWTGAGSPVNFSIWDSGYGDNSGSLTVNIYRIIDETLTNGDGYYEFEVCEVVEDGIYVAEGSRPGWVQVWPEGGTYQVDEQEEYNFVNDPLDKRIRGVKFNDLDGDGRRGDEPGLEGWTIKAVEAVDPIEVVVNSTNPDGTTVGLSAGDYLLVAIGDWRGAVGEQNRVDAEYLTNDGWATYTDGNSGQPWRGPDQGDLIINNQFIDWGPYHPGHVYLLNFHQEGDTVNFSVFDGNAVTHVKEPGWYADNSGEITVLIFKVIAEDTTDENGNYELIIPCEFSEVFVVEIPQHGWQQTGPREGQYVGQEGLYYDIELEPGQIIEGIDFGNQEIPYCGNGRVEGEEECDDGNRNDNDACNNQCQNNPVTIKAYKIVCDSEAYLPNWGNHGSIIDDNTAQNFVDNSQGHCRLDDGWKFQYGPAGAGSFGPFQTDTSELVSPWTSFGPTSGGETTATINDLSNFGGRIETREVFKDGSYVPFSNNDSNNVSAEFYCTGDVFHYDNWEWLNNPQYGNTYYCVAFNAPQAETISGRKWEDKNGNGYEDAGDNVLSGWTINLWNGASVVDPSLPADQTTVTAGDGSYSFENLLWGNYTVCEEDRAGWEQTFPGGTCYYLTVGGNIKPADNIDFGNFEHGKLSGYKVEDIDGDGNTFESMSEPKLDGWTINLDKHGEGIVASAVTGDGAWADGYYEFIITSPGTYTLTEEPQAGWIETYPDSITTYTYPVSSGLKIGGINFLNYQLGKITACKWDDYDGDGEYDEGEPGMSGIVMSLYQAGLDFILGDRTFVADLVDDLINGDGEEPLSCQTDETGCCTFDGLYLGDYAVEEDIEDPDLAGYEPTSPTSVPVILNTSGQEEIVDFFNELQPIELSLDKSNDKEGVTSGPGVTVGYTLVVTNDSEITAYDVTLTDVLPYGFSYVDDSGSVDGTPTNPSISGSTLTWSLGDIPSEGSVTIIYQALTASDLEEGTYTNMAVGAGYNRPSGADDRERSESDVDDSVVRLAVTHGLSASIGGTVLGISIEKVGEVLGAATGAPTIFIIIAILMIVMGFVFYHWEKIRRFGLRKVLRGIILSLALLVLTAGVVQAVVKVSITDLPDYLNTTDFKVYYTALDTSPSPSYNVAGWLRKEGGSWKQFDVTKHDPSGFFQAKGENFDGEAKYDFKIVANGVESLIETVTLDFTSPEAPRDYRKERISSTAFKLYWRNPDDSDFAKVFVYRSEKQDFTADDSTKIGDRGGSPDQEMDYVDGVLPVDKEYFYAIRALDKAGNASGLAGDGGSVTYEETIVEITPTPGEVVILPAEGAAVEEGQILGGAVEEEVPPAEEAGGIAGAVARITGEGGRGWLYGLGFIILGIFGYLLYRRRS